MPDKTPQSFDSAQDLQPEPTQLDPISTPSIENPTENQISEPNPVPISPNEPIEPAPIQTETSGPTEMPPEAPHASPSPEEAIPVKDDISANEPLEQPNITIEKHGNDVTITEVMTHPPVQNKQKELWRKFLEKLNFGKRKKLEKIMKILIAKGKITNDEVEKALRVSHATATRYLDNLEKEGKIRQVGTKGKYTYYQLAQ